MHALSRHSAPSSSVTLSTSKTAPPRVLTQQTAFQNNLRTSTAPQVPSLGIADLRRPHKDRIVLRTHSHPRTNSTCPRRSCAMSAAMAAGLANLEGVFHSGRISASVVQNEQRTHTLPPNTMPKWRASSRAPLQHQLSH